jgi:hypothetical protein
MGIWLFDLHRLEQHKGRPARLAAETRAKKNAEMRLSPQKSIDVGVDAAVAAADPSNRGAKA